LVTGTTAPVLLADYITTVAPDWLLEPQPQDSLLITSPQEMGRKMASTVAYNL